MLWNPNEDTAKPFLRLVTHVERLCFNVRRHMLNVFPSSNCANVITSPVCYFEDVVHGVYVTAGRIAIASE